jgi:hypothetical protein
VPLRVLVEGTDVMPLRVRLPTPLDRPQTVPVALDDRAALDRLWVSSLETLERKNSPGSRFDQLR